MKKYNTSIDKKVKNLRQIFDELDRKNTEKVKEFFLKYKHSTLVQNLTKEELLDLAKDLGITVSGKLSKVSVAMLLETHLKTPKTAEEKEISKVSNIKIRTPYPKKDTPANVKTPKKDTPANVKTPKKDTPANAKTPKKTTTKKVVKTPKKDTPANVKTPKKETPANVKTPKKTTPKKAGKKEENLKLKS